MTANKGKPIRGARALQTKQRILGVAEQHFSEKGFYGARVDDIAADAKINKRMIYEYHTNKEKLYENVLLSVYARMEKVERDIVGRKLTGIELIKTIIYEYFEFLNNNPSFVNILMWENLDKAASLNKMPTEKVDRREMMDYFAEQIRIGKSLGIFSPDIDENHMVLSLITVCFSNFSNRYTLSKLFKQNLGDDEWLSERKQHTTDMILTYMTHIND